MVHTKTVRFARTVAGALSALVAATWMPAGYAQEQPPITAVTSPQQAMEKIEVTGSLVPRIEGETALPIAVVTRDEIQKTGATTVEQLMTQLPMTTSAGATTSSQNAGATTGGLAAISIHALGSTRTLVLINGRRVIPYGIATDSTSVDVNQIPAAAIERIEILKEGASAIYGSDAIAGVVNFILRREYKGVEISANEGETEHGGGGSRGANLVWGIGDLGADRYNLMLTGTIQKQDPLYGRQRTFASNGLSANNLGFGYDFTSRNTYPGNITVPGFGRLNPSFPGCAPSSNDPNFDTGVVVGTTQFSECRFDPSPYVPLIDSLEHQNILGSFKYNFSDKAQMYLEASFNRNIINNLEQPSPVSDQFAIPGMTAGQFANPLANLYPYNDALFGGAATPGNIAVSRILLNPTSPYYPFAYVSGAIAAGGGTALPIPGQAGFSAAAYPSLNVNYRTFLNGQRDLTDSTQTPRIVLGLKGNALDWDYDAYYLHTTNQVTEHTNGGYFIQSQLLPILNSGQVNLLYPGFGPAPTAAQIAQMQATNFIGNAWVNTTYLDSIDGKISHDFFNLPGGATTIAVGGEVRREKIDQATDPFLQTGDVSGYGGNFLPVAKQRYVYSAFAEWAIPILKQLEADLAVRYDNYENTGSRASPKLGLRFQPIPQVLFRGSISRGFRAPSLTDLYAPNTQSVTTALTDPLDCVGRTGLGCKAQFTTKLGGNSKLGPERSTNVSLGIVLQPIKNVSASFDYFDVHIKNVIAQGGLNPDFIFSNLATWGYLVQRSGTQDPTLPGAFPVTLVDQTNINLGAQRNQGFDANLNVGVPMGYWGKTTFNFDTTYYQRVVLQNPDGSWTSQIDTANQTLSASGGVIPRYKFRATLDWAWKHWDTWLAETYQGSYWDLNGTCPIAQGCNQVSPYSITDLNISYTGFKHFKLAVGVNNLFDRDPPFTGAGGGLYFQNGFDPSYADPRGRFYYGTLTVTFQ